MMNRTILCLGTILILLLGASSIEAQWAIRIGGNQKDGLNSIFPTPDGGYIASGSSETFGKIWVIKLDSSGKISWQSSYIGSGFFGFLLRPARDGGYILAGDGGGTGLESGDAWFMKLDSNGKIVWQNLLHGYTLDMVFSVAETSDGGYAFAGGTYSFGAGLEDGWVVRVNSSGNVMWQKTYGGSDYDTFRSVQQTKDGGFIVAGSTGSFGDARDAWVLKLDGSGNMIWQKRYGGGENEFVFWIEQTSDAGYVFAGRTESFTSGDYDAWIVRLTPTGAIRWQKRAGRSESDQFYQVQETADKGFIVSGSTETSSSLHQAWFFKLNSGGNKVWQATYGISDSNPMAREGSDGGFILGFRGRTTDSFNYDMYVFKTDKSGKIGTSCGNVVQSAIPLVGSKAKASSTNAAVSSSSATVLRKSVNTKRVKAPVSTLCSAP